MTDTLDLSTVSDDGLVQFRLRLREMAQDLRSKAEYCDKQADAAQAESDRRLAIRILDDMPDRPKMRIV